MKRKPFKVGKTYLFHDGAWGGDGSDYLTWSESSEMNACEEKFWAFNSRKLALLNISQHFFVVVVFF